MRGHHGLKKNGAEAECKGRARNVGGMKGLLDSLGTKLCILSDLIRDEIGTPFYVSRSASLVWTVSFHARDTSAWYSIVKCFAILRRIGDWSLRSPHAFISAEVTFCDFRILLEESPVKSKR